MSASYDYLNARAKAQKARLLPNAKLRELSRSGRLTQLVETLAATAAYAADIRAGELPETAAGCEAALLRSLSATFHRMWSQADDEVRRWLEVWLAPWDLANVHVVLRALRSGTPAAALTPLWNATGMLPVDTLNRLAALGTIAAFTRGLASEGALFAEMARALRVVAGEPERRVEDALVHGWAEWAVRAIESGGEDAETFAAFFAWEIDGRNVRTALRLVGFGDTTYSSFLPGGTRFTKADWLRMAGQTRLEEAMALLPSTPFAQAAVVRPGDATTWLESIDHRVRELVLKRSAELYERSDPLGIGVLLHFVRLKSNEIDNLRLMAYGLERALPAGFIEEQLTLVQGQSHLRSR